MANAVRFDCSAEEWLSLAQRASGASGGWVSLEKGDEIEVWIFVQSITDGSHRFSFEFDDGGTPTEIDEDEIVGSYPVLSNLSTQGAWHRYSYVASGDIDVRPKYTPTGATTGATFAAASGTRQMIVIIV